MILADEMRGLGDAELFWISVNSSLPVAKVFERHENRYDGILAHIDPKAKPKDRILEEQIKQRTDLFCCLRRRVIVSAVMTWSRCRR